MFLEAVIVSCEEDYCGILSGPIPALFAAVFFFLGVPAYVRGIETERAWMSSVGILSVVAGGVFLLVYLIGYPP